MNPLELCTLPLAQLVPAPYNPRRAVGPKGKAFRKLRASLEEFGLVEPLVWNRATGHVVGGHLRLQILRQLNWTEVPVSVVNLTPEREKALNVLLNNAEAQGRYDPDKLRDLLGELEELPEFDLTGFDPGHLADLRFEPLPEVPPLEPLDRVEVVLEMSRENFERAKDSLDGLVKQYDLVSHVRCC